VSIVYAVLQCKVARFSFFLAFFILCWIVCIVVWMLRSHRTPSEGDALTLVILGCVFGLFSIMAISYLLWQNRAASRSTARARMAQARQGFAGGHPGTPDDGMRTPALLRPTSALLAGGLAAGADLQQAFPGSFFSLQAQVRTIDYRYFFW
jgi:hypothetical protein